jgi:serine phosphatase RsbU (regulator of sigma subunit)
VISVPAEPTGASGTSAFSVPEEDRRRPVSILSGPAWRLILVVVGGCLASAVANQLWGVIRPLASWITLIPLAVAWQAAVRFLLLDTRGRRFWLVWQGAALLALVVAGPSSTGLYVAIPLTALFLLFRRYRPYQHLGSGRRAASFGLGLLALVAVVVGWFFQDGAGQPSWLHGLGLNLARYAIAALQLFWILSLLHLFFGMRLHFLRLKPKLAISALFIALVPLVLFTLFGLVALYAALGGTGATRGLDVLRHWEELVATGTHFGRMPFTQTFHYRREGDLYRGDVERPPWFGSFLSALADTQPAGTPAGPHVPAGRWSPVDTTGYFRLGTEIWLLQLHGVGGSGLEADGYRVDTAVLDSLSALLNAEAGLYSSRALMVGDEDDPAVRAAQRDTTRETLDLQGHLQRGTAVPDSLRSFWQRRFSYGGAVLRVIRLGSYGFWPDSILLHLKIDLAGLSGEFVRGENSFNQALVVALAVLAALLLFIQIFALFFGLRIASGITSAVKVLHQGTRRLASGDLTTHLELPNEDELGDLAASFNEMTAAVARGREQAVARERLEREMATARAIQERLLPHEAPLLAGFEMSGTSLPSRQVGGDYFDFLKLPDGRLGLAIGDVSGKGMPAALLMSNLQASLQGQVIHPSSVSEIVGRVNDLLVRSTDPHMFTTFFYGVLDRDVATFTSTNAGHNPPLLCRAGGTLERLTVGGLLLGMLPDQEYAQQVVQLDPGDVIVLYTDGITEAVGPLGGSGTAVPAGFRVEQRDDAGSEERGKDGQDGENGDEGEEGAPEDVDNMFGEEALLDVVRRHVGGTAAEIKEAVLTAVARHTAGTPQSDDITLVVLKRQPS